MLYILINNYSIMSGYTIEPLWVGPVPRHNTVPPLGFPPTTYWSCHSGTIPAELQCSHPSIKLLTFYVKIIQQRPKLQPVQEQMQLFMRRSSGVGGQGFQSHMDNHVAVGFLHSCTGTDPLEGPIASQGRSLPSCLYHA